MLRHELDFGPTQVCNDDIPVKISKELYHKYMILLLLKCSSFIFKFNKNTCLKEIFHST